MRGPGGCPGLCNCQPITPTLWEGPARSKWHSTASAGVLGTKEGQKTAGSEQIAQGSLRQTRTVSTLMVHLFSLAGPRAIQTQPFPRKGSSKKRTPLPCRHLLLRDSYFWSTSQWHNLQALQIFIETKPTPPERHPHTCSCPELRPV